MRLHEFIDEGTLGIYGYRVPVELDTKALCDKSDDHVLPRMNVCQDGTVGPGQALPSCVIWGKGKSFRNLSERPYLYAQPQPADRADLPRSAALSNTLAGQDIAQ